ncbi:MAG: circularly permuted type 2 ATP-grasp protein [Hyphomicrobiaceae bacterium]
MTVKAERLMQDLGGFLADYRQLSQGHDELLDADGNARPHWARFIERLMQLPKRDRLARTARLDREVRETGLAHNIFADPDAEAQQWRLNLSPLIISASEWAWLEAAIAQRAKLFNLILADIYGPQDLMRSGKLPADCIFQDSTYLRQCNNIDVGHGHLHFYAADLARGPDGLWRVIDNHAETPAGLGYVVANRMMHTDVTDDLTADYHVRRLSWHFLDLQESIADRLGRPDPNVAVLTPGPGHEDYFSHAYIARYLDLHLVEGEDLKVVGNEVFLKTLEGLKRVDALIRCSEGSKSDPLELDPSGFLGPSGLVHASRSQPNLVLNSLGSAIIENRALGTYLPALCQELLGEPLMLPDAPRWWLGDAAGVEHVKANLDSFVIRPAREGTGRPGRATRGQQATRLTDEERNELLQKIASNGAHLVAEERLGFGTMPSLTAQGLTARPFGLRLFASAIGKQFQVVPGGLAMALDHGATVALSALGGDTHDVWVLSDEEEERHQSLWKPRIEAALVQRSQRTLQSRVADNLFWLGRYLERSDWTMRVIRSALARRIEYLTITGSHHAGDACLRMLLEKGGGEPGKRTMPSGGKALDWARQLVQDRSCYYSLIQNFEGIYRVASLTRDRLSLEAWRTLAEFRVDENWRKSMAEATLSELLDEVENKLPLVATFNGHMHGSMTRNFGWMFLDMGRRMERAINACDALRLLFAQQDDEDAESMKLGFMLRLADSYITYRSRYRLQPILPLVLDLLVMDETNPRSIAFQLAGIGEHLENLPMAGEGTMMSRERKILLGMHTSIRLGDVHELSAVDEQGARGHLIEALDKLSSGLPELSDAISRHYFRLSEDAPHRVVMITE